MSFKDDWRLDKERKRQERSIAQFQRRMASPIARGEVFQYGEIQLQHIASLALALEALEDILVSSGVLKPDELMGQMRLLAERKQEQVEAAQAAAEQPKV